MSFDVSKAMRIKLSDELPPEPSFDSRYRRAPNRGFTLSERDAVVSLKNALRYIPEKLHVKLAPEFLNELVTRGRIYGYRYRPEGVIKAKPIDEYEGVLEAKAIQLMIDNNLDFDVALYPYELVSDWSILLIQNHSLSTIAYPFVGVQELRGRLSNALLFH